MNLERLQKLAGTVRTGGKGSVRRKHKAVHKASAMDDKKLQATVKRLGVTRIAGIEEVNVFKDDDVVHFINPKGKYKIRFACEVVNELLSLRLTHCGVKFYFCACSPGFHPG